MSCSQDIAGSVQSKNTNVPGKLISCAFVNQIWWHTDAIQSSRDPKEMTR